MPRKRFKKDYVSNEAWIICYVCGAPILAKTTNSHRDLHALKLVETA
jgi:hypothetical protein